MSRLIVGATWDDAPHLTPTSREELWASIPPYQRDARSKGIPQLGAGAIYPIAESDIVVRPFDIPKHWPRGFGFDVGWNRTAAVWVALDRESGILYLWSEYYRGEVEPVVHAEAIKSRGAWVPGRIDPAARGRGQIDGQRLMQMYGRDGGLGLDITAADNAVETGIYEVWTRLSTGRLRVFASLGNWLAEYRLYRRDEKGKIVKKNDHLMDATRYAILPGVEWLKTEPVQQSTPYVGGYAEQGGGHGWMS